MEIPVVDFGVFSLDEKNVSDEQLQQLSKELKKAFSEVGFVFLKNTGITEEEVEQVMTISKTFFLQPDEVKHPFSRSISPAFNHGWVPLELESLNPKRPGDLKEAFNVASVHPDIKWPSSGDLKAFQEIQTSFFLRCKDLSLRVLRVMAISLGLDPEVFLSAHRFIGMDKNTSTLRVLYYPAVNHNNAKEDQVRCGEHSDYGSLTLLFQGSDGLQVHSRSGEFISVPTIPGAVLINIADMMQRWTSDQLISVVHRVLLPPVGDSSTRQSLAFFVQPDDEALITCCDGSNKYPPIESRTYLLERYKDTYGRE
ncbi:2-oxoglutarate-dependent dioxygenase htyE [Gouania willdenowi]|uniref:2-oxoglutarate-dependent dioxygenase htyE-like n=1 Tax=Gouania willdenowi TaxID=441366 RepID=A0A8C5DT87_GOUWI|nr:2-oxoglutarate-dependent dioxygenase htyE-like [Gouania willdenowi]